MSNQGGKQGSNAGGAVKEPVVHTIYKGIVKQVISLAEKKEKKKIFISLFLDHFWRLYCYSQSTGKRWKVFRKTSYAFAYYSAKISKT